MNLFDDIYELHFYKCVFFYTSELQMHNACILMYLQIQNACILMYLQVHDAGILKYLQMLYALLALY